MLFEQTFFKNWYGIETKEKMKEFLVKRKQLASRISRKDFQLQCRRYKVIPKSLQINLKQFSHCIHQQSAEQLSVKFSYQILNASICKQFLDIESTKREVRELSKTISNMVPVDVFQNFKEHSEISYEKELLKRRQTQKQRLEKLTQPIVKRLSSDIKNKRNWVKQSDECGNSNERDACGTTRWQI